MSRERSVYLQILRDLKRLEDDVDQINTHIHELLDEYDKDYAKKHIAKLKREGKIP